MNKVIDHFNSVSGWSGTGTIATNGLINYPEFVAGLNDESLMFYIPAGNNGNYIEKTVSVDITGYTEIRLSVKSFRLSQTEFRKAESYLYAIEFGDGTEYLIPVYEHFTDVTLYVPGLTSISRIRISARHDLEDYLLVSECLAIKDDVPLDIFKSLKEHLEAEANLLYGSGKLIGTVSGTAADTSITIPGDNNFLERYSVILISDGVNTEKHQILEKNGTTYKFSGLFDGSSLQNDFTDANVYLVYSMEYGFQQKEAIIPSVNIWAFSPEPIPRGSMNELEYVANTDDMLIERREGSLQAYSVALAVNARHFELVEEFTKVIRNVLNKNYLWINGKKYDILWTEPSQEIENPEAFDLINKVIYTIDVEIREEVWQKKQIPKTVSQNQTTNIQGNSP